MFSVPCGWVAGVKLSIFGQRSKEQGEGKADQAVTRKSLMASVESMGGKRRRPARAPERDVETDTQES